MKKDEAIYKSVFQLLILVLVIDVFEKQHLDSKDAMVNFEDNEGLPIPNITQRNQFYV
jgi:hypothetical protein